MTHGNTPTRVCAPTRAVRLALEEIGPQGATAEAVYARALEWSAGLGRGEVDRVVRNGLKDGWLEALGELDGPIRRRQLPPDIRPTRTRPRRRQP